MHHVNVSEPELPDPRFVLLQPDITYSETGYLTAVHKNVYFGICAVLSHEGPAWC